MSRQSPNGSGRFRVSMSRLLRETVLNLHRSVDSPAKGASFVRAFRTIIERLGADPLTFGEPLYRLPALQLEVRQAAIHPLVVDFAVHDIQPIVFIRGFKLLP